MHYEDSRIDLDYDSDDKILYLQLVDVPEMEYYAAQGQGEVCVQGANVFKGYFKEPEKTRQVIDRDGWHHTGDIGKWLPVSYTQY